jgi:alpha-amylase
LAVEGTTGDATLRSNMNWNDLQTNQETQKILTHWQKLGQFRRDHPSIGAGIHNKIADEPYTFSRTLKTKNINDKVVVGLYLPLGMKEISVGNIFKDGSIVLDRYSNTKAQVIKGKVKIYTDFDILLLEKH